MPMVWNEAAIAKLFLGVLAITDVKVDFDKLAEYMGPGCTSRAVQEQIKKMRKNIQNTAATPPPNITKTQKSTGKRKAGSKTDTEDTPSKKTKLAKIAVYDDGEDGEDAVQAVVGEKGEAM